MAREQTECGLRERRASDPVVLETASARGGVDFGPPGEQVRVLRERVGVGWPTSDRASDAPALQDILAWERAAWLVVGAPARVRVQSCSAL